MVDLQRIAMVSAFVLINGTAIHYSNTVVDKLNEAILRGLPTVVVKGETGEIKWIMTMCGDKNWCICAKTGNVSRFYTTDKCMFAEFKRKEFDISRFSEKVKGDGYSVDPATREVIGEDDDAVRLNKCGCILLEDTAIALAMCGRCPKCEKVYPEIHGAQPNGCLLVEHHRHLRCGGHPDQGTYILSFDFPSGVQTQGMQNVGSRYLGRRVIAYVPSDKPDMVRLLVHAFERGVLFTVGHSLFHDEDNRIVFGNIHMKTELNNTSGHGWDAAARNFAMGIMLREAEELGIKLADCKPLTI